MLSTQLNDGRFLVGSKWKGEEGSMGILEKIVQTKGRGQYGFQGPKSF